MRTVFAATAALLLALGAAQGAPDPVASTTNAGFSRRLVADTVAAVLPKKSETTTIFATVRITAEIGEDR
jgi:hypothetical protein